MVKSIDEILEGLSSEDRAIIKGELSEKRKIEDSLQEVYSIINKSPSVAFTWKNSEGWPVEFVTENVKNLFGYTAEELKSGNVPYVQCIHPDDLERVAEEVSQFSNEEGRSVFIHKPYRIVTKEGIEKIVDDKTSIVRDENGNVTHYQGILTDITEKRIAEAELITERDYSKSLLDTARAIVLQLDTDGNIVYFNPYMEQLVGYELDEVKGKDWFTSFLPECDYEEIKALFKNAIGNTQTEGYVNPIVTKKGDERQIEWYDKTLKNSAGEITGLLAIGQDITERIQVEEALKESEETHRTLFNLNMDGYVLADYTTGEIIECNDEIARLVERNKSELIGNYQRILHPEKDVGDKQVSKTFEEHREKGTKIIETELITKSGNIIPVEIKANSLIYKGRNCLQGQIRDITERKQAEKTVIQSERLRAIGELASGVAHDFNNSLQGIFGNIELALLEDSSPEVRDYLKTIKNSASDAASRIQQLQRFAGKRTESSEYQVIDFYSVVDDAIAQTRNLWKDEAQKNGVNIAINTHYGDDVSVLGNLGDLRSVTYNLIKNSVQAMPDGGVIDICTRREGEKAYLTLTDTGEGMDEETKKRIFQPFYTTKGFEQGKGLGMSAAHSIIQEHNGEIYVKETGLGKGTTFEIAIPYAQRETAPEKDKPPEYEGIARVLWVDDEEMIRDLGKMQLERMGHKTDVASDGYEALELLASNEYDLMITDGAMPNMSGWQLAEQIKGKYSGMKVAMVTGYGDDVGPEQKKQFGLGYVLGKPTNMDQLKGLVGEVLQMKTK